MSLLGRQQLELGKQEMKEIASEKAMGAGLLTAGAILGLFMLGFLAFAGAEALAITLPRWASFLIVAGVFLILTLIAVFAGREALRRPAAPERTKQTVKEDVEWAKRRLKR
jgi:membrane protein implicated in regulation of membrane protease activity